MMTDEIKALVTIHLVVDLKVECKNVIGIALLLNDKTIFYSYGTLEKEQMLSILFYLD